MRGRSCSKQRRISSRERVSSEIHKVKEEPHLSGAYIRSLVKHLTSATTKHPFHGDRNNDNNMQQESPSPPPLPLPKPQPQPQPQHKKQVRRRQHTTRPYQERLLNMAEARREIVTALKFHRASMKQQKAPHLQSSPQLEQSQPSNPTTNNNLLSLPYYWPISTIVPPPLPPFYHQNLNFKLPNQTLGLNLNFQEFQNLDTPHLYHNPLSSSAAASSSSSAAAASSSASCSSTSSSATFSFGMAEEVVANSSGGGSDLHHAMDDEEMEEIRSLGEQHQMEWNDTVNLVESARWFNFLNTMEIGFNPSDQVVEFPHSLIDTNETSCFQQHFSDDCLQDPALPCRVRRGCSACCRHL